MKRTICRRRHSRIGGGETILSASREQGLEGVVAKLWGSKYEPGKRTGAWLKVKNVHRQEFVIGGWITGQRRRTGPIGSVVVGYWQDEKLVSAGGAGTGFTDRMLVELAVLLEPLARDGSPFDGGHVPRETLFVDPRLVCEVRIHRVDDALRRATSSVVQGAALGQARRGSRAGRGLTPVLGTRHYHLIA